MKSDNPYISVIIPTYNRAEFIAKAIESVLGQKDCKWPLEVIVVDDGSTDGTEALLKPYENKIRYFKIPHSGLPAVARNFGISKAKGQLIAFQDSDDIWAPDKLAEQVPLFDDASVMMAYTNGELINERGASIHRKLVDPLKLDDGEKFQTLVKENVISTLTVIARKNIIDQAGGFDESEELRAIEDYDLWLRVSAQNPKGIKSLNKTLALHRIHPNNISGTGDLLAVGRLLVVYDKVWENGSLGITQQKALERQIEVMQENWNRLKNEAGSPPLISVVMSMYNSEPYLRAAIKSILEQTFGNYEFIIIDDGCVDKSAEIVHSFGDPRIRLVHQLNHGMAYSFNKAIRLARADFIARMDHDDISMPSRLEKELAWITADEKRGLVGTFFAYIDKETKPLSVIMTSPTKHIDIVRMMYIVNPFGHGSIMMRKQAVDQVGGYRAGFEPADDFDLWCRIAEHWEIGQIPEVLYWWRLHYKNISHTQQKNQNETAAKISEALWAGPVAAKSPRLIVRDASFYKHIHSTYRQTIYQQYIDMQAKLAFKFLVYGRLRTGYKTAAAALWLKPSSIKFLWKTLLWAPIKYFIEHRK